MGNAIDSQLQKLADLFDIDGAPLGWSPLGNGHINATFVATYADGDRSTRYVHQRINTQVFGDPVAVMDNVSRVLAHLAAKRAACDPVAGDMATLQLVPASDGQSYTLVGDEYWRTYAFVEGAETIDAAATPAQVRNAAGAYGRFQRLLADLPGPLLTETIPGFHDTGKRYSQLEAALQADRAGRTRMSRPEIEFAKAHCELAAAITRQIEAGDLPTRITHNDTKLNNVMLDVGTGEAVCVIDLDTVMPGTVLYDFGDMVRSATITAAEDEQDSSTVQIDLALFEAIVDGYLGVTADWLTAEELASLRLSCQVITFECGIRFLADFLNGDRYFKTAYPEHNLVRCRTQFALLADMQAKAATMDAILQRQVERRLPLAQIGRTR